LRLKEAYKIFPSKTEKLMAKRTALCAPNHDLPLLHFHLQKIVVKTMDHHKFLWLMGIDKNGLSTAIKILDFQPTFLMRSPDLWDLDDVVAADELLDFIEELNAKNAHQGSKEKIKYAEFVYMSQFIGFTNRRQDRMVKFVCNNINDASLIIKYLKENKYTLYHEDFDLSNQFLQQTNFSYQEWLTVDPLRSHTNKLVHTCIEGYCMMENLKKCNLLTSPPNILKAFIRLKAVSRDGVIHDKVLYKPNPNLPFDRILALGISYVWSNSGDGKPFREVVHTLLVDPNPPSSAERKVEYQVYGSEKDMLEGFRQDIIDYDPDDIFYFPDELNTLTYLVTRILNQSSTVGLKLDRFKNSKMSIQHQSDIVSRATIETRCMFNMEAALQKKVFISIESYDLYTCSCHKALRKTPQKWNELLKDTNLPNKCMKNGTLARQQIIQMLLQDLQLLVDLERDTGMRMEYLNVSKASDTDLTDVVSRGEQIRVFNKLTHFCIENNTYVNREKLSQKPIRFRIDEKPPTFKDPADLPLNLNLREECFQYLQQKLNYHPGGKKMAQTKKITTFEDFVKQEEANEKGEKDENDEDEDEETKKHAQDGEEEAEGGNVMKPACKFWDEELVFIDDFASLYPSIMMAFNLSYENLVYDAEYLNLEGVEYFYVPVTKFETVATANLPGIFPKMLRQFVDNRAAIKRKMKNEKDPFLKNIYDYEQNSMKVLCNGTYGFCGAEKKGSLLAVKAIMYMVTALGRYLQKFCCNYVGEVYNMPCIYGDSVTEDTPILCRLNGKIFYRTIDDLPTQGDWFPDRDKECRLPVKDLEVWNDTGFTELRNIIRHKTDKKIYRVLTHTGCVCVTEDHSLLTPDLKIIKPTELKIGGALLHYNLPQIGGDKTIPCPFSKGLFYAYGSCGFKQKWAIKNSNINLLERARKELQLHYGPRILFVILDTMENYKLVAQPQENGCLNVPPSGNRPMEGQGDMKDFIEEWRELFYDKRKFRYISRLSWRFKKVPDILFECDTLTRTQFFEGYCAKDMRFENQGQIGSAGLYLLSNSLGYNVSVDNQKDKLEIYNMTCTEINERKSSDVIKKIEEIPNPGKYVFDLTTKNGRFAAGVGRVVVKNTDSIFKLMPLYKGTKDDIEEFCVGMGAMYKMQDYFGPQHGFSWTQVVNHYRSKPIPKGYDKPVDPALFVFRHQVHCIAYLICEKICAELTAIIARPPVELNFENMATKVWMGTAKKYYACLVWKGEDPSKWDKIKITGMPAKTRAWSPWTRRVLTGVLERIVHDKTAEIPQFLTQELDAFVVGKVPIRDLMISKKFKNKLAYKNFKQPHLHTLVNIEKRTRAQVKENSRIYFVMLKGTGKQYMRAETPEFAEEKKLELDLKFYLEKQFEKPMKKLLTYHPHILNFTQFYTTYVNRLKMKAGNMLDIADFQNSSLGKRQLTGDEVLAKRKKVHDSRKETKHKTLPVEDANDPFLKLFNR